MRYDPPSDPYASRQDWAECDTCPTRADASDMEACNQKYLCGECFDELVDNISQKIQPEKWLNMLHDEQRAFRQRIAKAIRETGTDEQDIIEHLSEQETK